MYICTNYCYDNVTAIHVYIDEILFIMNIYDITIIDRILCHEEYFLYKPLTVVSLIFLGINFRGLNKNQFQGCISSLSMILKFQYRMLVENALQ